MQPQSRTNEDQNPLLPRPAPRPQHRLRDGLSARQDGRLGPAQGPRRQRRRSSSATPTSSSGKATARSTHLFRPEHVDQVRAKYPDMKVIVHPECKWEVVQKADMAGSTAYIVKQVEAAPPGSAVGHRHRSSPDQPPRPAAPRAEDHRAQRLPVPLHDDVPHRPAAPVLGAGEPASRAKSSTRSKSTRTPASGRLVALERMLAIKGTGNPIGKQQPVGTTVD